MDDRTITLIREEPEGTAFWEAGLRDRVIIVHRGRVGEPGETHTIPLDPGQKAGPMIECLADGMRRAGYHERDDEAMTTVMVQYEVDGFGVPEDLEKRYTVEEKLDEALHRTGNGLCDGGDIGSGTMNVFCMVVDREPALTTITQCLEEHGFMKDAVITYEQDDEYVVAYPPDLAGETVGLW